MLKGVAGGSSTVAVSGITGLGTGVATALGVNVGSAGAPVVNGGALGTPSSGTLTSATGLPIGTGVSGLGTGVATALAVNVGSAGAFTTTNASDSVTLSAGDITTTSTSLVDLTGATITITTGANKVLCGFSTNTTNSGAGSRNFFNLMVDAALQLGTDGQGLIIVSGTRNQFAFTFMTAALTAASHTFKIQWMVSADTGTVYANAANKMNFWVREVK